MLQNLCECNPNTLSLLQPKVLEAIDYIRNTDKQHHDVDAVRSEASNIDKTTVVNVTDTLIDRNVIENRKSTSGQVSYFHCHEGNNKNVTVSPEKTCEVNLPVTTNNIATTPLDVTEALNSSNNPEPP